MAKDKLFSGEASEPFWDALNRIGDAGTFDDVEALFYVLCCKLQEMENRIEQLEGGE